jgi:ligand-binding sensor domain-containing protein/signal transduction histidine kinase
MEYPHPYPALGGEFCRMGAKRFCKPRRLALALLLPGLVLSLLTSSFALDPGRSLSQYRLVRWDEDQGLPQNRPDYIGQTRDGFIWLGTDGGLVRFDGKNFATGKEISPDLKEKGRIRGLVTGRAGELWFGCENKLVCRFADGEFKAFENRDGLPDDLCFPLFVDSAAVLWVATPKHGLLELKDGHFLTCPDTLELTRHYPEAVGETGQALWIATDAGIYEIGKDSDKIKKFTDLDGLPAVQAYALTTDREGRLWAGTEMGLARLDNDGRFHPVANDIGSRRVNALITDSHGMLWAGGSGGRLWRINSETEQVSELPPENGRVEDVGRIYEDREGNIWFFSNLALQRLSDVKFTTYTSRDGLSNDMINAVATGAGGRVWIGTINGLACLTNGKIEPVAIGPTGQTTGQTDVLALYEDPQGALWVGLSDTTLHRLDRGQHQQIATLNQLAQSEGGDAKGICSGSNGDLWVGTAGAGVMQIRNGQIIKTYTSEDGLRDPTVYSLAIDRGQRLWIGGPFGVDLLEGTTIKAAPGQSAKLLSSTVSSLYADSDGTLWAGTRTGLYRFRNGLWAPTAYQPDPQVLGPEFYCLLEDDLGNLWSSGSHGIFFVSKSELNEFFDGKRSSVNCRFFGKADGLKSANCYYGCPPGCRSADGRLWFATVNGLAVIDPNHLQFNSLPPPVQIERIVVDLHHVFPISAASHPVELGPGAHHLEFDYTGLSFVAPEKVRFKYKLEGFDRDWIDAGTQREAYYTNLAPGTYRFRVNACNNDGLWAPEGAAATTTLSVQPHFYQTLWFYALCAGVIMLAVWLLWRWRLQQILEERTRMSRELHDTVARSSVALLWQIEGATSLLKTAGSEPVLEKLQYAAKLARENLKETRRAMRALRSGVLDANRSLPAALDAALTGTAEGGRLKPELKVSGTPYRIQPAWEQALVRIAQECLTNTMKYANAKRFVAELAYSPRELRLRLRDDGIGFEYKPGGGSRHNGPGPQEQAISSGLGLVGIEERCRQLGGTMRVESGTKNGTTIEIVVPRGLILGWQLATVSGLWSRLFSYRPAPPTGRQ